MTRSYSEYRKGESCYRNRVEVGTVESQNNMTQYYRIQATWQDTGYMTQYHRIQDTWPNITGYTIHDPISQDTGYSTEITDLEYIDGLVQDRSNSIANALELLQSCTKSSIYKTLNSQITTCILTSWMNCRVTISSTYQIDGLVHDCSNSSALATELLQSCAKQVEMKLDCTIGIQWMI